TAHVPVARVPSPYLLADAPAPSRRPTLSLHDALPIFVHGIPGERTLKEGDVATLDLALSLNDYCADTATTVPIGRISPGTVVARSEEHTSELQSRGHLVCRLLLEKKNPRYHTPHP